MTHLDRTSLLVIKTNKDDGACPKCYSNNTKQLQLINTPIITWNQRKAIPYACSDCNYTYGIVITKLSFPVRLFKKYKHILTNNRILFTVQNKHWTVGCLICGHGELTAEGEVIRDKEKYIIPMHCKGCMREYGLVIESKEVER